MTNTLGGGGDFDHFMDHLGPALKIWLDDMHRHQFKLDSQEEVGIIKEKVKEWLSHVNLKEIEKNRDEFLSGLVRSKLETSK